MRPLYGIVIGLNSVRLTSGTVIKVVGLKRSIGDRVEIGYDYFEKTGKINEEAYGQNMINDQEDFSLFSFPFFD